MKKFKKTDFIGQLVLVILFSIISVIRFDYSFIIGYVVIGAWQLASIIIHHVNYWNKDSRRKYYQNVIYSIVVAALFGFLFTPLSIIHFFLLFASPFFIIIYMAICYEETYRFKRPSELI